MAKVIVKVENFESNIQGTPVKASGVSFEFEISDMEIATFAPVIEKIAGTASTVTTTTPIGVTDVPTQKKIPSDDGIIHAKEPKFSITKAFTEMPRPNDLESVSYMKYRYKKDDTTVDVDASEYNCIHIHVYAMKKWMHAHVRPNNASFIGSEIKPEEMDDFLGASGLPVEIQEYIKKLIIL